METSSLIHIQGSRVVVTPFTVTRGKAAFGSTIEMDIGFPAMPTTGDEIREAAQSLATSLARICRESSAYHLILPGTWCLAANVETLDTRRRGQAALFAFEQLVPTDLEKLTSTVTSSTGRCSSVVCLLNDPVMQLVTELEDHSQEVASINIDAHVISHSFSQRENTYTHSSAIMLLVDQTHISIIHMLDKPNQQCVPKTVILPQNITEQELSDLLNPILKTMPPHKNEILLAPITASPELLTHIMKSLIDSGYTADVLDKNEVQQWLHDGVLAHSCAEFRHGLLANKRRWAKVSSVAKRCAACLALFMLIQGIQIRSMRQVFAENTSDLRAESQQIYSGLFPGSIVPPGVAMRLRSERIKLEGMTKSDQMPSRNEHTSGLCVLDILGSIATVLPSEVKLFVNKLVIDDAALSISGRTTDHAAAGIIVQALHKMPGIQVDPPSTKLRSDKTVEFRIRANLQSEEP